MSTEASSAGGSRVIEFPRPPRPRRRWLRWVAAALVVAGLIGVGAVLYFSSVLAVDRVSVSGTRVVPQDQVEQRLEALHGIPLPQVGQGRVEQALAGVPGIDRVSVLAAPPTGLDVQITEYEAVGRAGDAERPDVLMADGSIVTAVPEQRLEESDVVALDQRVTAAQPAVRMAVADTITRLTPEVRDAVAEVSARSSTDIRLTLVDGEVVLWGDAHEAELKAGVLATLVQTDGALDGVTEIDVSVPERPVTR
ncbi:MAG: FtsQ-type POTRA domain-containing protein [Micrococcus sp.]|nr:FtsQ-type POTRA domain-containing protein [Micrococcus sp.]